MRKKMKTTGIVLFVLGLIVSITGYCLSNADDIPGVLRAFAPRYVAASSALLTVKEKRTLLPGDAGFDVLRQFILERIKPQVDKPEVLATLSIQKIERYATATTKVGGFQTGSDEALRCTFSNGQTMKWQLSSVESKINELKHKSLFRFSVWIFVGGIVVQLLGYVLQLCEKKKDSPNKAIEATP